MALVDKVWEFVKGYVMLAVRMKHIEERITIINREMGSVDVRLTAFSDTQHMMASDISYIRGKVDGLRGQ
ncbi:MAG TPA: hypothetical protein ACFYED_00135 [Candidatus Tripitaka californicus]|uniref:hypothetical protein n=1 Tax=Candidatus Tripitaka californicus TaxID=3367616 RepID=UPI00402A24DB